MSHEPKPSEHAMQAAEQWSLARHITDNAELALMLDRHAIAPAVADVHDQLDKLYQQKLAEFAAIVAERDQRIKELEAHLKLTVNQLKHTQHMAENGYGPAMLTPDIISFSEQILAKSERSAP